MNLQFFDLIKNRILAGQKRPKFWEKFNFFFQHAAILSIFDFFIRPRVIVQTICLSLTRILFFLVLSTDKAAITPAVEDLFFFGAAGDRVSFQKYLIFYFKNFTVYSQNMYKYTLKILNRWIHQFFIFFNSQKWPFFRLSH